MRDAEHEVSIYERVAGIHRDTIMRPGARVLVSHNVAEIGRYRRAIPLQEKAPSDAADRGWSTGQLFALDRPHPGS